MLHQVQTSTPGGQHTTDKEHIKTEQQQGGTYTVHSKIQRGLATAAVGRQGCRQAIKQAYHTLTNGPHQFYNTQRLSGPQDRGSNINDYVNTSTALLAVPDRLSQHC